MNATIVRIIDYLIAEDITLSELFLNTLLAVTMIVVIFSAWTIHRGNGRYKNFNLVDLVTSKDGKLDGAKCMEWGTFMLLSWGFVVYVTAKNLPEWYMQTFIVVFVLRGGYGAYLRANPKAEQSSVTKTVETKETVREVQSAQPAPAAAPAVASATASATAPNPNMAAPSSGGPNSGDAK